MSAQRGRERSRPDGTQLRYGPTGKPMRVKSGGYFWSDEAEEEFFDVLAASCNVTLAAATVGFCTPTLYRLRRKRPEFAARWKAALEQGYARLEAELLGAAIDSLCDREFDANRPIPRMTVDQAMNVLRAHRNAVEGDGQRGPGRYARVRSLDEVRASIMKKVEAIRNGGSIEQWLDQRRIPGSAEGVEPGAAGSGDRGAERGGE